MVTTPSDAIRLPARASWAVLLAGAIWFGLAAWWLGVPVLIVLVLLVLMGILHGLEKRAQLGLLENPWSTALFWWSPVGWLATVVLVEMRWYGRHSWWPVVLMVLLMVLLIAQYACVRVLRRAGDE